MGEAGDKAVSCRQAGGISKNGAQPRFPGWVNANDSPQVPMRAAWMLQTVFLSKNRCIQANQGSNRIMHSRLIKGVSFSLLFASFAAVGADWVALGLDSRGNAWHIDRASVVRGADQVQAWKRIAFREPAPQLGNSDAAIKVALVLDVTDCNQRQVDVKALRLLDGDGAVLAAHEHDRGHGLPWPSGGQAVVQEKAVTLLCSDAWREHN